MPSTKAYSWTIQKYPKLLLKALSKLHKEWHSLKKKKKKNFIKAIELKLLSKNNEFKELIYKK